MIFLKIIKMKYCFSEIFHIYDFILKRLSILITKCVMYIVIKYIKICLCFTILFCQFYV